MTYVVPHHGVLPTEPLQIVEPFRGRNDTRRNLVGLSRDDLKTTLVEAGLEPFRARQVWQWIYWHGVTDFGRMTNIAKKTRDRLAELFVVERPRDRDRAALDRRHAQMAAALPRRQRGRDGQHPRGGSRLGLRLEPGRLHAHLQLLPHRHPAAGAQPRARRDRRPVHGGARQLRRMADADRDHAHAEQHRHDGHGRAALQFRQRGDRAQDRHGRAGHRAQPPAHHALDLGRRADDPQGGRGARRQPRGLAACRERRCARHPGADQPQMADRRAPEGLRRLSRRQQQPAHHLRVRHAEGRQRQRRRCARAGAPADAAARQGEPDPVQPVARRALRVQLQQPHAPLRRDRERRRPQRADPHAARPRHLRRLRPAQERERARRGEKVLL